MTQHQAAWDVVAADPQELATGINLARARAQELLGLLQADPESFAHQAVPPSARARMPRPIQAYLEQTVSGRGFFGVYCVLPGHVEDELSHAQQPVGIRREVRLQGKQYEAFVYGNWRDQLTADNVDIEGIALDGAIAIGATPVPVGMSDSKDLVATAPSTSSANTLLYMIAQFSDETTDPITEASATPQMTVVSNFWVNNSGGTVWLHGLVNPKMPCDFVHIRLPQPKSYGPTYNSNFGQLLSDARAAATALGYNYSSYNLDAVVTSSQGFGYAGRSYIGGQGSHWVVPYTTLRTVGHELGHNLGLWHANYWRTDSTHPFGQDSNPGGYVADANNGEWVEYGHYFSVMSAQYGGEWDDPTKPHYSVVEKAKLGWLSGTAMQYVSASGMFRLFRHDALTTAGTPRAIRIEVPATDYTGKARRYWLQYRYAPWASAQNWYRNGLEIDVAQTSYGSDGSIQLDVTPFSSDQASPFYNSSSPPGSWWTIDNSDKLDGALALGRTFEDAGAGVHITPIAAGNNGTGEEYLDVAINLGSFPGNRAPAIEALSASSTQVSSGQSVSFAVAASDPDGDALAYSWNFDDGQAWTASGLNSPTANRSWSSAGQYRVLVTVSDLRGGSTTASTIVTVGAPANTNQVWGRVLWAGHPVAGARVVTASGSSALQAWTESDGSYALTDVPAGSYSITCSCVGLTFTPQFANPVLVSRMVYGTDFYANEAWSGAGAGGAGYTISGQVTDPVNGAVGVEVRGAGLLAVSDGSGNYQLTNIPNGTYTVSAQLSGWGFSPASRLVSVNSANSSGNNFSRVAPWSISGTFSGIPAGAQDAAPVVYLSNGHSAQATRGGTGGNRYWTYTLNNVPTGHYSITAELAGYSILPSGFSDPLVVSDNITGANFLGAALAGTVGTVSGRVTQYGVPLVDVELSAALGATVVASAQSDSDGYFRINNLATNSYTLIAAKAGFSFSPASLLIPKVPSSGIDFSAFGSVRPPTISWISASPTNVASSSGTAVLSVMAVGTGPLTYRWDAVVAPGPVTFSANDSAAASFTTVTFQAGGAYTFRAKVTDTNGFATTSTVAVTVNAGTGTLVVSPYEISVGSGQSVTFHADAWDQLGNSVTISPSWSVSGGGTIDDTGVFIVTSPGGPYQVTANASSLSATGLVWVTSISTNASAPSITAQPQSLAVAAGSNVTFRVTASGSAPMGYQWRLNGSPILGASQSSYSRTNAQTADAGSYTVVVTNSAGLVTSSAAVLTVNNPPVLPVIASRTIHAGTTLVITNAATDSDTPAQQLAFSLDAGAPAGAIIGATNGILTWSTSPSNAGTSNDVTVRVTDTGVPSLSASSTFHVALIQPLSIQSIVSSNGTAVLCWNSAPGTTYRAQYKQALTDAVWNSLSPDIVASGVIASFTNTAGTGSRFYRISVLP